LGDRIIRDVLWPFAIGVIVFWLVAFKGRPRGNLTTMRDSMERYRALCRKIAFERLRLPDLQGAEHAEAVRRLESMEQSRAKAEARAWRLSETLRRDGFSLDSAQLTTVDDAEAELRAEMDSEGDTGSKHTD
jgi:hypothetical protein